VLTETGIVFETVGGPVRQGGKRQESDVRGDIFQAQLQTEMVRPERRTSRSNRCNVLNEPRRTAPSPKAFEIVFSRAPLVN